MKTARREDVARNAENVKGDQRSSREKGRMLKRERRRETRKPSESLKSRPSTREGPDRISKEIGFGASQRNPEGPDGRLGKVREPKGPGLPGDILLQLRLLVAFEKPGGETRTRTSHVGRETECEELALQTGL